MAMVDANHAISTTFGFWYIYSPVVVFSYPLRGFLLLVMGAQQKCAHLFRRCAHFQDKCAHFRERCAHLCPHPCTDFALPLYPFLSTPAGISFIPYANKLVSPR